MSKSFYITLTALVWCGVAGAGDVEPFYTFSKGPLVQLYGLPAAQPGTLLNAGEKTLALAEDIASHHVYRSRPRETVFFDGESYRTTLIWRQGLSRGFEWGLDLPYTAHNGGVLDHTIYEWHHLFGMPQGGRGSVPNNQLLFRYVRDGRVLLDFNQSSAGIGDVRLSGAMQLLEGMALRASLKLPTGDSEELLGSGAADLALSLNAEGGQARAPIRYFGSAGALALGRGDVLPEQQRSLVGFGSTGVAWSPPGWPTLQAQLDGHTPFYDDSELVPLGSSSLSIVLGAITRLGPKTSLDLALSEDLVLGTAPDVTFHLRLRSRY